MFSGNSVYECKMCGSNRTYYQDGQRICARVGAKHRPCGSGQWSCPWTTTDPTQPPACGLPQGGCQPQTYNRGIGARRRTPRVQLPQMSPQAPPQAPPQAQAPTQGLNAKTRPGGDQAADIAKDQEKLAASIARSEKTDAVVDKADVAKADARSAEIAVATARAEVEKTEKEMKLLETQAKKETDPETKKEVMTRYQTLKSYLPSATGMWKSATSVFGAKDQTAKEAEAEADHAKTMEVAQIRLEGEASEAKANGDAKAEAAVAQKLVALVTGEIDPEPVKSNEIGDAATALIESMRFTGIYGALIRSVELHLENNHTADKVDDLLERFAQCAPRRLEKAMLAASRPYSGSFIDPKAEVEILNALTILKSGKDRSDTCPASYESILERAEKLSTDMHEVAGQLGDHIQTQFGNHDPSVVDRAHDVYPVFDEFLEYARKQYVSAIKVRDVLLMLVAYISKSYASVPSSGGNYLTKPVRALGNLFMRHIPYTSDARSHNSEPLQLLHIELDSDLASRLTHPYFEMLDRHLVGRGRSYDDSVLAEAFLRYLYTRVPPEVIFDCPYTWSSSDKAPYFKGMDPVFQKYPPQKPQGYEGRYSDSECATAYPNGWYSGTGVVEAKNTVASMLLHVVPSLYRFIAATYRNDPDRTKDEYTAEEAKKNIVHYCMYPLSDLENGPAARLYKAMAPDSYEPFIAALRRASTGFVFTPRFWVTHREFWNGWASANAKGPYPGADGPACDNFSGIASPKFSNSGLDAEHREAICRGDDRCEWTPSTWRKYGSCGPKPNGGGE